MADARITLKGCMSLAALRGIVSEISWLLRRHGALELGPCGERILLAPHGEVRLSVVVGDGDSATVRIELEWSKVAKADDQPRTNIDLLRLFGCAPLPPCRQFTRKEVADPDLTPGRGD